MIWNRSVFIVITSITTIIFLFIPANADDTRPGQLYLSVGGGWGNYENGNEVDASWHRWSRISSGPAFSGESRVSIGRSFSIGIGIQYLTGSDNLPPPTQSFHDDYIRFDGPGDPFSTELTALYLKVQRSFEVKPFQLLPVFGISKLWGQVNYPVHVGEAIPPNLPPLEERAFKSGGFGYLLGLKSSLNVYRFLSFETEIGYRFFKLGDPEYEDGTTWPGSNLDFSGPYLSGGFAFRIF